MKRSLGRNWGRAAWAFAWLLLGGGAMAQAPEQHWQATPNYPSNYPPNYQPSTAQAGPARGRQSGRSGRRPRGNTKIRSSPINRSAHRNIRRSSAVSLPRPASRPTEISRPTIARPIPRIRGRRACGPGPAGRRAADPRSSRAERPAAGAVRALAPGSGGTGESAHGLGKAEQRDPRPGVEVLSLEIRPRVRQRQSAAAARRRHFEILRARQGADEDRGQGSHAVGAMALRRQVDLPVRLYAAAGHRIRHAAGIAGQGDRRRPAALRFRRRGPEAQAALLHADHYAAATCKTRSGWRPIPATSNRRPNSARSRSSCKSPAPPRPCCPTPSRSTRPTARTAWSINCKTRRSIRACSFANGVLERDWWKPSIPCGWTKKTELPPPPVQAGLNPSMSPRR